jgi:cellulose synthase/poly-beta-1,6-N-acetylglucosamine synthase-like glycosyltransferase
MLTVFIATYNGAATLPRVLAAYTQLQPPAGGWKLVIIDNGSNDGSAQLAQSFADRLPLVCVCEPIRGKNRALNTGLLQLDGDLAVFSDDDTIPEVDWLVQLRSAADLHREYAVFGGVISPVWEATPDEWIAQWVRLAPVFSLTEPSLEEGPCDPTRVWGPNMAIRAELFEKGYRFDERLGPNGSATYAMGGETELTLRLSIAERLECWHCKEARVRHIIPASKMTRSWILKRAFRLGRCVYRESQQKTAAGRPHVPRYPLAICKQLAREALNLASARSAADARRTFEARWQVNLHIGCLFEAVRSSYKPQPPGRDASTRR